MGVIVNIVKNENFKAKLNMQTVDGLKDYVPESIRVCLDDKYIVYGSNQ